MFIIFKMFYLKKSKAHIVKKGRKRVHGEKWGSWILASRYRIVIFLEI